MAEEVVVEPLPSLSTCLASVDQVQFSFEIVPTQAVWFQTFLRDDAALQVAHDILLHPVSIRVIVVSLSPLFLSLFSCFLT